MQQGRRLPVGAEVTSGGVHFRVWAPRRKRVEVVLEPKDCPSSPSLTIELESESNGYFSTQVRGVESGCRYRYRLDSEAQLYPDPASRFQPEGPHGPSEIIDPSRFTWSDANWRGVDLEGQVLCGIL